MRSSKRWLLSSNVMALEVVFWAAMALIAGADGEAAIIEKDMHKQANNQGARAGKCGE